MKSFILLFALIACSDKTEDTGVTDTGVEDTDTEDTDTEDTDTEDTDTEDTEDTDTEDTDTEDTDTEDPGEGISINDVNAGELIITEVMKNPCGLVGEADPETGAQECSEPQIEDENGEWFEIHNLSSNDINLNGLIVSEDPGSEEPETFVVTSNAVIPAGGHFVFGNGDDETLNGGYTPDYTYVGGDEGFKLGNSNDEIALSNSAGLIDMVAYDNGDTFHDSKGYSLSLKADAMDSASNDDGSNWCKAGSVMSSGDMGTPGAVNDCAAE